MLWEFEFGTDADDVRQNDGEGPRPLCLKLLAKVCQYIRAHSSFLSREAQERILLASWSEDRSLFDAFLVWKLYGHNAKGVKNANVDFEDGLIIN